MKTKIFIAFLIVILTALLSNFVFEWLIMRDFENYVSGVKEDQLYWITVSTESSYDGREWDRDILSETIHWAMMMGLDTKILDLSGQEIISSHHMMESLPNVMKKRMEGLFHIDKTQGIFEEYPLYSKGKRIGTLYWRPFMKKEIAAKEARFKKRTRDFLIMSFLIVGIGSLLIAVLFSQYLSKPVTNLKSAAEKIAKGDFSVRTVSKTHDEVGKLSEVFNRMAESLQKEDQLRKRLMSNIAHELRTPLTIMKTHVEAITDGIVADKEKGLKNINEEIGKLTKLIKGIEDITTAESSFFTRSEEKVNLKELLSGIKIDLQPLFHEKDLEIKILDDKDIVVVTDVEKLETIIRNILSNALKFTEKGSVSIHYGTDKKMFFVEIKDTGKGMPEDEIPHIFDRFYKVDKSASQGLGIGLAIVKELINVMNGEIKVKSTVHEGTSFTIFFPIVKK